MKLSILILSIPERLMLLNGLFETITDQITGEFESQIEILALLDNKCKSIAEKEMTY